MTDGALRFDTDKTEWSLLPFDGLDLLAQHYTRGAKKYAPRNWEKGMKYSRCFNSLQRHLTAWWHGEDWDVEAATGWKCLHLVAVVWNAMALLVYTTRGVGEDDRPKKVPEEVEVARTTTDSKTFPAPAAWRYGGGIHLQKPVVDDGWDGMGPGGA